MAMILLYYVLLAVPLPLLWLAWRARGWPRVWLIVIAVAGLAAMLHEVRMWMGPPSAIRLDIPLLAIALGILYLGAALVLFRPGQRWAASALALVVLAVGGGMAYQWHLAGLESKRLTKLFLARNALLFEAKFRNAATYELQFGPFDMAAGAALSGHWLSQDDSRWSRLIINAEDRIWLFHHCGDTECTYAAQGARLEPSGTADEDWRATLTPRVGTPLAVRIKRHGADRLSLTNGGRTVSFVRAAPPIHHSPDAEALNFLGSFAAIACRGQHAVVRQLWLWRDADRLYALAIAATLVARPACRLRQPAGVGRG